MKIMISQPMRDKTNEQIREERAELVEKLKYQGHEVVDTVFEGEMPIECDIGIYLLNIINEFKVNIVIIF